MTLSVLLATSALLATAPLAAAEDCTNYGIQVQVTVIGDNSQMNCTIQHCEHGSAGAGAAGVGVGTAGGEGEGGASASAGTECDNGDSDDQEIPDPCTDAAHGVDLGIGVLDCGASP